MLLSVCLLSHVNLRGRSKEEAKTEYFTQPVEQPETFVSEPEPEIYKSPVDFEALMVENKDIYAWLDIPGTDISYPLLQHPEDDTYYLRRDIKGERNVNGVLFTEASYNNRDFSDPLTIVYGHNISSGEMFGTLQATYSSVESMAEHSELVVYLPDRELHYTVFAAVPYDSRHILYNYDFTNERTFRMFFQELLSIRAMQAVYAEDAAVSPGEKTIFLSTCLIGNRKNRFLVCGKLVETVPADENKQL